MMYRNFRDAAAITRQPLLVLGLAVLILIVAFFPEIQGLYKPYVGSSLQKRELFVLELAFVILILLNRRISFPDVKQISSGVMIAVGVWLLWSLLAAVNAEFRLLALLTYAEHLALLLFGVSLYALLDRYKWAKEWLLWVILAGFVVYCLFLVAFYFPGIDKLSLHSFITSFIEAGFRHIRHVGYYLAVVLVITTGIGVARANLRSVRILCGGLSIIAWGLLFWLGGRGPLVALLLTFPLFVYLAGSWANRYQLTLFFVITLVFGAAFSLLIPGGFGIDFLLVRLFPGMGELGGYEYLDRFSSARISIWLACTVDIVNHPFFGLGQNNYGLGCGREFGGTSQPHGFHIQALLDWGVVGAVSFALFVFMLMKSAYSNVKTQAVQGQIAGTALWGASMLLLFSGYDGILFQRFSLMFFAVFVVLALPESKPVSESEKKDGRSVFVVLLLMVVAILLWLSTKGYAISPEYITI
jgi:O-antigen ligase